MIRLALRPHKLALLAPALFLATAGTAKAAESGVSPIAHPLFEVAGFPITNAMVTTWFFCIIIVALFRWAAGKPKLIPGRGQTVVEDALLSIREIVEPIVGSHMLNRTFPLLITFFFYILIMNWSGLLPGAGTIGIKHAVNGHEEFTYFFRPANSDLNTTVALTLISFAAWIYFVLRYAGLKTLLVDIFGNKADKKDVPAVMYYSLFVLFFLVGFIEIISILSRLLSLPFRLYGNIFGGESLLDAMYSIFPWGLPIPFYFLELLVGLIQAFVFTVLTAVYIGLICNHEGGEHDEEGHAEGAPAGH